MKKIDLEEVARKAADDRKKLIELLDQKPAAVRNLVLSMYDRSPNDDGQHVDLVGVLSLDNTIKTRIDLSRSMATAGVRFGSPEYNDIYDRYCLAHPEITL